MISQLVATGICPEEAGFATFLHTLPFLFYPLLVLLCGLLYALGVLPVFGSMRQAYRQLRAGELTEGEEAAGEKAAKHSNVLNFILPVALVTAITIVTGEILYGTLLCLVFCAVLYLPLLMIPFVLSVAFFLAAGFLFP